MPFEIYEIDDYTVVEFDEDHLSEAIKMQQIFVDDDALNNVIYIALEGIDTSALDPSRFLVKNKEASWINHMMWRGLLTQDDQRTYTINKVKQFIETNRQMIIEEYDFVEDEPFYDYSGR